MRKDVTWFDDVKEMRQSISGYTRAPQPEYEPVKAETRKPKEVVVPDEPQDPQESENVVVPDKSSKQGQKKNTKKAEVKKEETADE